MLLHAYLLLESSNLPAAIKNGQLLQYGHAYQLNDRANVKTMDARAPVLHNGTKTEMVAPQNDRPTEWSVNFLLTTTVQCTCSTCKVKHYHAKPLACCISSCK